MSENTPNTLVGRESWGEMNPTIRTAVVELALNGGFPSRMTGNILANVQADRDQALLALIEGAESFPRQPGGQDL